MEADIFMDHKIIIGLPKALLFYKYSDLWINFFENLGCEIILSPDTNMEILNNGLKHSIDESCLSLKIYLGHIEYLKDKCDYILVPRIVSLSKNKKLCTNFSALYDIVRNTYPDINIIHYNINIDQNQSEIKAFIKMGRQLNISLYDTYQAYRKALDFYKRKQKTNYLRQLEQFKNDHKNILLVSHPYNLHDPLIGKPIIDILTNLKVNPILSDTYVSQTDSNYKRISNCIYWSYNIEMLNAIMHYQDKIDGIIIVTTFPCGPDSLVNELIIRKVKNIPVINIIIDELVSNTGLETRLESFIDIINLRSVKNEK